MIIDIAEKEPLIYMYLDTSRNKNLDVLLQQVVYLPNLERWEGLQNKIFRMRSDKTKQLSDLKEILKSEYYISGAKECPHYYYDAPSRDIYRLVWRKLRHNKIDIPIGTKLYHLARVSTVDRVLKEGLIPSKFSSDGVFYGANKVFFSTAPILDEDNKYIDGHLYNRTQLEIIYDGTYYLYEDHEYDHNEEHTMAFTLTETPIRVDKISDIQPKRKYPKHKVG